MRPVWSQTNGGILALNDTAWKNVFLKSDAHSWTYVLTM